MRSSGLRSDRLSQTWRDTQHQEPTETLLVPFVSYLVMFFVFTCVDIEADVIQVETLSTEQNFDHILLLYLCILYIFEWTTYFWYKEYFCINLLYITKLADTENIQAQLQFVQSTRPGKKFLKICFHT